MKKYLCSMGALFALLTSCQKQEVLNDNNDVGKVNVKELSSEMIKVRDYVPANAVLAHRGTTFWAPEETEAAFRWAREIGADYLEADLQTSKDGVLLALHDDNLKRTTNIENVFGDNFPTQARTQYYNMLGLTPAEIQTEIIEDMKLFVPAITSSYTYYELMMLDCGEWFNEVNVEQRRNFGKQFASTLEDLVQFSRGQMIVRTAPTERAYAMTAVKNGGAYERVKSSVTGRNSIKVKYEFQYQADPEDSGHRPGIYIEFKQPWLNVAGFEKLVYDELSRLNMNIITRPEPETNPHYINGKVNVGNTNGKVILQTFSLESLLEIEKVFQGKVPMCFLLWKGTGSTDLKDDSPLGYASFINIGVDHKAHFIGPSIAGAPNNYDELLKPWQAELIRKSKMEIHPYSFDSSDQMRKYYGVFNFNNDIGFKPPYCDAMFTNRSEMTLQFYKDMGVRKAPAPQEVQNAQDLLNKLGYTK